MRATQQEYEKIKEAFEILSGEWMIVMKIVQFLKMQ